MTTTEPAAGNMDADTARRVRELVETTEADWPTVETPHGPDDQPQTFRILHLDTSSHVNLSSDHRVPNAYREELGRRFHGRETFPHGIDLEVPEQLDSPAAVARALTIADISQHVHETLEWVKVDGRRLADPHPGGDSEDAMWDWLTEQVADLIDAYAARWPAADVSTDTTAG